jgi:hypothetical protein
MQNIEEICFSKDGLLRTEFENLFRALFSDAEKHIRLETETSKAIHLTMITMQGRKENNWSTQLIQNDLTIDVLFE